MGCWGGGQPDYKLFLFFTKMVVLVNRKLEWLACQARVRMRESSDNDSQVEEGVL